MSVDPKKLCALPGCMQRLICTNTLGFCYHHRHHAPERKNYMNQMFKERHKVRKHREARARYSRNYNYKLSTKFGIAQRKAIKERGISFELTFEEYTQIVEDNSCYYCSALLPKTALGLDRVDNSKGYVFENVVACCSDCNRLKNSHLTLEEMKEVIKVLKELRGGIVWPL
jgi:hypothetical protein